MKKTRRLLCLLLALILLVPALSGCQKKAKQPECPFTSIKWGDTLDDVIALEGTSNDTYDSIYKGTTYTYAKEYDGLKGTVKYMFDDHEKLVAMA